MKYTVDILLATFNGAPFLQELLDSIILQSVVEWCLIVRDDGSSDNTSSILADYKRHLNGKMLVVKDHHGTVGVLQNFSLLMRHSTAPYIMFCDQDDVWMSDKVLLTLKAMRLAENDNNAKTPLLVHTDLQVVDAQLNIKASSFWQYQNLNPRLDSFNRLLVQNTITGCTTMINHKLLEMASPIAEQAIMHDWWMGLVAAAFGKIIIVEQATVLYRQHGHNDTGAKQWSFRYVFIKMFDRTTIAPNQRQADAFSRRFNSMLAEQQQRVIGDFANLNEKGYWEKRFCLFRNRLLKQGIIRNIGLFLRM